MLLDRAHDARWYEQRKRALVLASLTRARYGRVFEPACGRGALTAEFARRCGTIVAMDADAGALASTRAALAGCAHADVREGRVPDCWPRGAAFDLVVLSEFLYYLPFADLSPMCAAASSTLAERGEIVACHWRHPIPETRHSAEDIHAACAAALGMRCAVEFDDADFLLHVWTRERASVAAREGLAP